jgi:sugar lactone lactonase YvrE
MATYAVEQLEIFGKGVLQAEGVVIDKAGYVYGGGRNGIIYKVSPDGKVSEIVTLPSGSIPNGITMDRNGDLVYCDLGKQAVIRVTQNGQVSLIADRVGDVKLTLPNFASYDAEGNLYVSNTSTRDINTVLPELSNPEPNGALVRIRPNGKGDVVATGIYAANGTAIDPQEEAVYVLESSRNDCLRVAIKKVARLAKPKSIKGFPRAPTAWRLTWTRISTYTARVRQNGTLAPANQIIKVDPQGKWLIGR